MLVSLLLGVFESFHKVFFSFSLFCFVLFLNDHCLH